MSVVSSPTRYRPSRIYLDSWERYGETDGMHSQAARVALTTKAVTRKFNGPSEVLPRQPAVFSPQIGFAASLNRSFDSVCTKRYSTDLITCKGGSNMALRLHRL